MIREGGRLFAGREVLVIDLDGEKHGPITVEEGLAMAKEVGLNLVMVAENAKPQVCRIMDFGKLQYERKKKIRDQKKHHHAQKLKEVKFRLRIEKHDYDYKINHAIEFLGKGYKLKATLMFRGREMAHKEYGFELMNNVISDLEEYGKAEANPKMMGRNVTVTFSPINKKG